MYFDPFNKDLEAIAATDLARLLDISEGWYVEYKRAAMAAKNIGKSLAAFANHFGGWLIFGVDAPQRTPTAFPGLTSAQVTEVLNGLRDAIRYHVNPVVVFQSHEVAGPCDSIGLPADRSIVVVRVPQGHNPPYVHSSGRIYRRLADSSDPRPETDRAVIDQLVSRAHEYKETFRKRIESRPEFSEAESSLAALQIFVTTDPWEERSIRHVISHAEFAEVMKATNDAPFTMAFESAFPQSFGFVARHVASNDPFNMLLTWEFSYRGFSSVVMPLRVLDENTARRYKHGQEFFALLPSSLKDRVLDATLLWPLLTTVFAKQDALAKILGIEGDLFAKFRFLNVWRLTPYMDSGPFLDYVRSHGPAVIQHRDLTAPPGISPTDMRRIDQPAHSNKDVGAMVRAAGVLFELLSPIGLPYAFALPSVEHGEFWEMFQRGISVHGGQTITRKEH